MCIWERRLTGIHQVHSGKTHRLAHRSKWLARRNTLILGGVYGSVSTSGICRCVRLGCERILAQGPGFADRGDAVRRPPQEGTGNLARGDFALERGTHRLPDTKTPAEAGAKSRVLESSAGVPAPTSPRRRAAAGSAARKNTAGHLTSGHVVRRCRIELRGSARLRIVTR